MRKDSRPGQQADGRGIAQAEGNSQATVNYYEAPQQVDRHRQQLLARVRSFWIVGVLDQSLHQVVRIALDLQEEPSSVANPWRLIVQESQPSDRKTIHGKSIAEVFDDKGGELLILGEAGAGKSTLLLQLAQNLLDRAERDVDHHIPVVFHLSSWATVRLPFADWLAGELHARYLVPEALAHQWVAGGQIIPLLDGLDEVAPRWRESCVRSINEYRKRHGLVPIAVCCRAEGYAALPLSLDVRYAISIVPLKESQLVDYFSEVPENLSALHQTVMQDQSLRTPLMLSVLTRAYRDGREFDSTTGQTPDQIQTDAFVIYVDKLFARRGVLSAGTPEQFRHWLSYLARQMRARNLTIFSLEDLQPDWLPEADSPRYRKITRLLRRTLKDGKVDPAEALVWSTDGQGKRKLSRQRLEDRSHLKPNEGVWRSLKHGLTGGTRNTQAGRLATAGLIAAGTARFLKLGYPGLAAAGPAFLVTMWLSIGDEWGVDAFVRHFTVRLLLSRTDSMPWDLAAFLDEASERLLMRKVGGSYMFSHALLLDYFADQDD